MSDIDETLARLRTRGATLVGDVVQYEDSYRLCHMRPIVVKVGRAPGWGGWNLPDLLLHASRKPLAL